VDLRKEGPALVTVPFELIRDSLDGKRPVTVVDVTGDELCRAPVVKVADRKFQDRTLLVTIEVPRELAERAAGIRVQERPEPPADMPGPLPDDVIICRCERVLAGDIRREIREGTRDMNQLKATLRCGMGACGGKTCTSLIQRIFREEGVAQESVRPLTLRPLEMEVTLGVLAGLG
jgi:bacterioferritin-associated ferredoxin